jgi:hypothetical protein
MRFYLPLSLPPRGHVDVGVEICGCTFAECPAGGGWLGDLCCMEMKGNREGVGGLVGRG